MREIVFDTETTGLDPLRGDRIVEIGCVELHNHISTGRTFQVYLNPQRSMPSEAAMVHGLTDEFLADKPIFSERVDDFLAFIEDSPLVAHNASFDMNFVNAEMTRCGFKRLAPERAIDTVVLARRMFPGSPASLDALCKRFGVDASGRQLHGALLDAELLSEVYLELRGGRQPNLTMVADKKPEGNDDGTLIRTSTPRKARVFAVPPDELAAHEAFLETLKNPLWKKS